jgi:acetyl-CoA carboxylase biotin carboxyl carrier protein
LTVALSDEDVREILRIIDESALEELRIETPAFSLYVRRGRGLSQEAPALAPPPRPAGVATPVSTGVAAGATIEAPMLGTFYAAESPSHAPFIAVGDRVEPETVVCLIEVMKLMNHIQAGVSGTISEVLAASGTLVEFGQPLFAVAPDA